MRTLIRKLLLSVTWLSFIMGVMAAALFVPPEVFSQAVASKTGAEKAEKPQKTASPDTPAVIPVPEIAERAAEVTNLLRDMKAKAASEKQIDSIRTLLSERSGQISRESRETKTILEGAPNLGLLQTQQQLWQRSQTEMKTWIQILTGRAMLLRGELEKLSNLNKVWSKTRDAAKRAKAPQIVLYEIDDLLRAIAAERPSLEAKLKSVLDLQGRVVLEAAVCKAALDQIVEAQQSGLRDITARDSIPIWIPARWTSLADAFPERLREVSPAWWMEMFHYLRNPALGMPIHIGLFVVLGIVFWAVRRRVRRWKTVGEDISPSLMVFERPFAAALLITLGMASGPYSGAPVFVKVIMVILAFAPVIRLIKPVVAAQVLPELYALWFLLAIDAFRQALSGGQFSGQLIVIIETLVGAIVLMWSLAYGNIRRTSAQGDRSLRTTVLRGGTILLLIALTVGAVAGILGYLSLARILASEVIAGATMALGMYAVVQVLIGVVAYSLRVWPLGRLYMAIHHREPSGEKDPSGAGVVGCYSIFSPVIRLYGLPQFFAFLPSRHTRVQT